LKEFVKVRIIAYRWMKAQTANQSHLLCYGTYEFEEKIIEDSLFCRSLIHTTAEEVYNSLNEFLTSSGIQWSKCIAISTYGAHAMSGRLTRLIPQNIKITLQLHGIIAGFTGKL
jgi:hypothetical protein